MNITVPYWVVSDGRKVGPGADREAALPAHHWTAADAPPGLCAVRLQDRDLDPDAHNPGPDDRDPDNDYPHDGHHDIPDPDRGILDPDRGILDPDRGVADLGRVIGDVPPPDGKEVTS